MQIRALGCFDMTNEQRTFLESVTFSIALNGTVQRGKLYRAGATDTEKHAFRAAIRRHLEGRVEQYRHGISENDHLKNIDDLTEALSKGHCAEALNGGRFRIGSAQKALNLYLKFLWCLDLIPMPPHCPFDSMVLARVPDCEDVKWTRLDDPLEYQRIVECAKREAKGAPLAEWELTLYTEAQAAKRGGV